MKTNQIMKIQIGDEGVLTVGHKEQLFKVREILEIGNKYINHNIGNSAMWDKNSVQNYLRSESTWRTIIEIHNNQVRNDKKVSSYDNYLLLDTMETMRELPRVKTNQRMIDYVKVLKTKQFAHIVRTQHGGKVENRGTYVNLYLAIDLAMKMNERFKVEIINVFIKGKILEYRDSGGDAFKELNKAIDTLPDRIKKAKKRNIPIAKNNKRVYIEVSKQVRKLLDIYDEEVWGYNDKEHTGEILSHRAELLKFLVNGIKHKMIVSYPQLKEVIKNFEF